MDRNIIYLDTYVFQKDNRIRLPKGVVENLDAVPGETWFDIFIEIDTGNIILKRTRS